MKKIGIITINDYLNYGNRLQNYATQEVLRSLGFEVETIVNIPYSRKSISERLRGLLKQPIGEITNKAYQRIRHKLYKSNNEKIIILRNEEKQSTFKEFTKNYIKETAYTISPDNIPDKIENQYDFFVVGSDQVWNPNFRFGSTIDFVAFAPSHKRIAFSPSFGVSMISSEYTETYKKNLSEMGHLSVREDAGARIIKQLTGREAAVLIDPTLMLSKDKWLSILKPAKAKPKNKFLLTYFLGSISEENRYKIDKIVKENDLEVVNLADINDKERYSADPSEFLDYIRSSSIFLTDSFHGVVFSILLEKPFIVLDRDEKAPSMNSRIDTLLSKFQLEDRKWMNIENIKEIFDIEYAHIQPIIDLERSKVLDYLNKALRLKDVN